MPCRYTGKLRLEQPGINFFLSQPNISERSNLFPVKGISVVELDQMRRSNEAVVVVDVREQVEREIASIPDTVHIPMNEVPVRLEEIRDLLDDETDLVVMCHSGQRSLMVARFLQQNGFGSVFNLTGGIDAWSREVDPKVSRY